jgi:hypothetical protein
MSNQEEPAIGKFKPDFITFVQVRSGRHDLAVGDSNL